jgi:ribosomal protein S18 acetylase RimI-like enzyme
LPEIVRADASRVDDLHPLWLELRSHQGAVTREWGPLRSSGEGWARRSATYRDILDEGGTLLLAVDGAELVGYAICEVEQGGSPTWAWPKDFLAIVDLVVAESGRRGGVGSALMEAIEDEARERGVDALDVMSAAPNEAARRFYEKHGFRADLVTYRKPLG